MEPEQTNDTVPVVPGQGETPPLATAVPTGDTGQPAPGQPTDEPSSDAAGPGPEDGAKGPIPFARFDEVNQQKNAAQQEATQLRQQVLMQQQQMQTQQQAGPAADPFKQFCERNGVGADGFVSTEDLQKVASFFQQQSAQQLQATQQEQWLAAHPDYTGMVVTPTGQISDHLMKAIQADPALGMSLKRHWDPVLAYHAAKGAQTAPAAAVTPQPNVVQQIQAGQKAPQGISAAAGGGGQVDQRSALAAMSDAEFQQWWAHHRGRPA